MRSELEAQSATETRRDASAELVLPLVVPILPTRQLVSTGTWDKSFWKDEIGWHELVDQTAAAWRSRTPAERAAGAIVAGNYGVAGALSLSKENQHFTIHYTDTGVMPAEINLSVMGGELERH